MSVWSGTPFPVDLVTSDSMSPSLMEGDVVAWTPVDIDNVRIGDVVVFKSYVHWPDEKIVVHRVSDILSDQNGNPILETKGDKNDWTDQAGPHIPEPYIREDHLMGKVISIGQQPLKVPFVGIIGLWINDGLDSISQPTASKESVNYLGVFAPLTISAVVLVILIFILPEKAKTFKEKIKLYVFGKRPLNLKKTITTFLIAYIIFLMFIHVFAHDSMSASVGINTAAEKSNMKFGRIKPGTSSLAQELPLINPGIMPVKGIIFGKGEIGDYVTKKTFILEKGEIKNARINAIAPENTANGSYAGDIMIYSSPFWLMFPDEFMESLYNWNAEATVHILDILSALIMTSITLFMLVAITFIGDKTNIFIIDRSRFSISKVVFKKGVKERLKGAKLRIKKSVRRNITWMVSEDKSAKENEKYYKELVKPIIASLAVIPLIFLITEQMLAVLVSSIISGIIAYSISCKYRWKILLTIIITMTIAIIHVMYQSNMIIFSKDLEMLELMTLSVGVIGIYLLLLTLFIVPLAYVSWKIVRLFRNLKERKDPLLSLEGNCDL